MTNVLSMTTAFSGANAPVEMAVNLTINLLGDRSVT